MDWTTIIGMAAAACTVLSFVPQLMKALKTRHTKDLSLLTYVIMTFGILLWLGYGIITEDMPIIIANGLILLLSASILVLKIKHG
ncbi:MAG: hypothetical protein MSIBF_02630 [Candidatus Altiarchaeales archaeon IMC4]|nr:MAG: hypothetical protein MSIBF_02630 [Candidatus Altiarchaeales archaeon IMC4]